MIADLPYDEFEYTMNVIQTFVEKVTFISQMLSWLELKLKINLSIFLVLKLQTPWELSETIRVKLSSIYLGTYLALIVYSY